MLSVFGFGTMCTLPKFFLCDTLARLERAFLVLAVFGQYFILFDKKATAHRRFHSNSDLLTAYHLIMVIKSFNIDGVII